MSTRFILLLVLFYCFMANSETINSTQRQSFKNGNPEYEISFKNKLKHGTETFWYDSGFKKMESNFVNGINEVSWVQWHKNGQLKS